MKPCILDIGCGCGVQTLVLAERLGGQIVAVDNHQPFLDKLIPAAQNRSLRSEGARLTAQHVQLEV